MTISGKSALKGQITELSYDSANLKELSKLGKSISIYNEAVFEYIIFRRRDIMSITVKLIDQNLAKKLKEIDEAVTRAEAEYKSLSEKYTLEMHIFKGPMLWISQETKQRITAAQDKKDKCSTEVAVCKDKKKTLEQFIMFRNIHLTSLQQLLGAQLADITFDYLLEHTNLHRGFL